MSAGKGNHATTSAEEAAARLKRARLRTMGRALQFGGTVVGSLVVFLLGGIWLDRRLDTSPLFLLVGLALAFAGIGYNLYELATLDRPKSRPKSAPGATATPPVTRKWEDWDDERERDAWDDDADDDWDKRRG